MRNTMEKLNTEIKRLVKDRGLKGYSMTVAPSMKSMKSVTGEDHGKAILHALSLIDSPNNFSLEV
jgi:hypothetical protein